MLDPTELISLLSQIEHSQVGLQTKQADLEVAEQQVKTARSQLYSLQQAYRSGRRDFIHQALNAYQRAMCAYCKKIRPREQMKTVCEMGYYVDSDCRYNRWEVPYEHYFPICSRCALERTYSTKEENGYTVGKALLDFDIAVHDRWIDYGDEQLNTINHAMSLNLPQL